MLPGGIDYVARQNAQSFNRTNVCFIWRSVLHELSTSPNEIKGSLIEILFIQNFLLVLYIVDYFSQIEPPLFSPRNIWHFA